MREEKDSIGTVFLEDNQFYGIHTLRAIENFSFQNEITSKEIIYELVNIKKQAAITNYEINTLNEEKKNAIVFACDEILKGTYDNQFIVPKTQGGAGTSTNMNVNEVIANIALKNINEELGRYDIIHPINDVNLHQSTNDVYPTAVKIALIHKIRQCALEYSELQKTSQELEQKYDHILKLGRTQLMDALPLTVGQMFSAYSSVFSRDRWRIYKSEERLRTINIGGTAIGTGLNAPIKYMFLMTNKLQSTTNIGLSRSENLIDSTQNLDDFLEVSGFLKTATASLIKIANDIRFLSSGPDGGYHELTIPSRQAGSSIMPGKVNPVILEFTIMNCQKIIANDSLIAQLVSMGNFELNQNLPMIAETLLDSLNRLIKTIHTFHHKCFKGITVNEKVTIKQVVHSKSLITPLIHIIGYDKASYIVKKSIEENKTIKEILLSEELFTNKELEELLNPRRITKPGKVEVE